MNHLENIQDLPGQVLELLALIVSDEDDLPEECRQMARLFIAEPELAVSLCDQFMAKVADSTTDTYLYQQALVVHHTSLSNIHIESALPDIYDRTGISPRPEDVQNTIETELEIANFMLEAATEATFRASAAEVTTGVRTAAAQKWMGSLQQFFDGVQATLDDVSRLERWSSRRLSMLQGPGGQFLLEFPNEVELESGVPIIWNPAEQDWTYAKLWNPIRKMPGSQWGKWFRNRFQNFFQTPKPDAPYSIIIPQYGCKMRDELNSTYRILSDRFQAAGRVKEPTKTGEEHNAETIELAQATGLDYASAKISRNFSIRAQQIVIGLQGIEKLHRRPLRDKKGRLTFEGLNTITEVLTRRELPPQFRDEHQTVVLSWASNGQMVMADAG